MLLECYRCLDLCDEKGLLAGKVPGEEIMRGGFAPSLYYTPLQPDLSLLYSQRFRLERGRGEAREPQLRLNNASLRLENKLLGDS